MKAADSISVWRNARVCPRGNPAEVIEHGAFVVRNGRIDWLGAEQHLPADASHAPVQHDVGGRWVTPGLVDCHTHLVYAGNRADEFAQRVAGASYAEIAQRGGGILSTVRATRAARDEELFAQSARRLEALLAEGVTALEIKSGYGLDLGAERKLLRVARRLGECYPVSIYTTFLGAHAVPPEYSQRPDDYIACVCQQMLPALHAEGLIDAVDVFCEHIGFSVTQSERVFEAAQRLQLPVKIHAEQLSDSGGTRLAARYHALSADHIEYLDEAGVQAMKAAGMVAVLLPGAYYFTRERQLPPLESLRRHQVPIALATDSNPGTSPTASLLLMLNMGCTLFHLTVAEALSGVTRHAAHALGKPDLHGELAAGRYADFAVWAVGSLAELAYWIGTSACHCRVRHGIVTHRAAGCRL